MLLIFISCGDTGKDEIVDSEISFEATFGKEAAPIQSPNSQIERAIEQWRNLESFLSEVQSLRGISYFELRNKSEILTRHSYSMLEDIPSTFDTQIIKSRILVLQTRSELLNQWAHNDFVDSDELENAISEINQAVNNLLLQLAEKVNKDQIDLQRTSDEENERKQQKRFQDSVYHAELKDQRIE